MLSGLCSVTRAATSVPGATSIASVLRLFLSTSSEKIAGSSRGLLSSGSAARARVIQPLACGAALISSAAGLRLSDCS